MHQFWINLCRGVDTNHAWSGLIRPAVFSVGRSQQQRVHLKSHRVHPKSLIWYFLAPRSSLEPEVVLGPPSCLPSQVAYSALRSEDRGARRNLWGAVSEDTRDQPSRKSFTGRHAPLLDISYWLDAAADRIDLIHHNITEWRQITD